MNHPRISIIGAPKSGTSSVHFWLSQFDEVCAANPKETFFFVDHDSPMVNEKCNQHDNDLNDYLAYFNDAESRLTLDSTTHYLYQDSAIRHFSEVGTKCCVILRDPVKRIVSYFQYLTLTQVALKKPVPFDQYIELLLGGKVENLRDCFHRHADYHALAFALDHGRYIEHLERWDNAVSADDLQVVIFENILRQEESELEKIATHFGLVTPPGNFGGLNKENETVNVRFPAFNRIARYAGKAVPSEKIRKTLRDAYFRFQRETTPDYSAMYPDYIEELAKYYVTYNQRLVDKYTVNISSWSTPRGRPIHGYAQ